MDDFNKQKIIYPETTQGAYFIVDSDNFVIDKTCFMITGEYLEFLSGILSSSLFEVSYKKIFSSIELGKNAYQYNKHALIKLPIITPTKISEEIYLNLIALIKKLEDHYDLNIYNELDNIIFKLYNLSNEEIEYIKSNKK